MRTRSQSKPVRLKDKTVVFHVKMKNRSDGNFSQLKFGNFLIHEGRPKDYDILISLCEKWNKRNEQCSTLTQLRRLQLEACVALEKAQH